MITDRNEKKLYLLSLLETVKEDVTEFLDSDEKIESLFLDEVERKKRYRGLASFLCKQAASELEFLNKEETEKREFLENMLKENMLECKKYERDLVMVNDIQNLFKKYVNSQNSSVRAIDVVFSLFGLDRSYVIRRLKFIGER